MVSSGAKAPNLERHCVMYSHLLYANFGRATHVYNNVGNFKKFFKLAIGLFDETLERIPL